MKRAAISLVFVILLAAAPGATLAKVPWHSVEIQPAEPVAGEPFTVVVRFWGEASHTNPLTWWPDQSPEGVVALDGPGGRVPVTLSRTGAGTYAAEVTLAEGTWTLLIDQGLSVVTGPSHVDLATVTVAAAPIAAGPVGAAVIGVALVTAGVIWRRRRSPSLIEHG